MTGLPSDSERALFWTKVRLHKCYSVMCLGVKTEQNAKTSLCCKLLFFSALAGFSIFVLQTLLHRRGVEVPVGPKVKSDLVNSVNKYENNHEDGKKKHDENLPLKQEPLQPPNNDQKLEPLQPPNNDQKLEPFQPPNNKQKLEPLQPPNIGKDLEKENFKEKLKNKSEKILNDMKDLNLKAKNNSHFKIEVNEKGNESVIENEKDKKVNDKKELNINDGTENNDGSDDTFKIGKRKRKNKNKISRKGHKVKTKKKNNIFVETNKNIDDVVEKIDSETENTTDNDNKLKIDESPQGDLNKSSSIKDDLKEDKKETLITSRRKKNKQKVNSEESKSTVAITNETALDVNESVDKNSKELNSTETNLRTGQSNEPIKQESDNDANAMEGSLEQDEDTGKKHKKSRRKKKKKVKKNKEKKAKSNKKYKGKLKDEDYENENDETNEDDE